MIHISLVRGLVRRSASPSLLAAALLFLATSDPPLPRAFAGLGAAVEAAGPCGDVDCSGAVSASDALAVLRRAVGSGNTLTCPESCPVNLASATSTTAPALARSDSNGSVTTLTTGSTRTTGTIGTSIPNDTLDDAGERTSGTRSTTPSTIHVYGLYAALEAAVCGDFDCGGTVAASDALAVLRAAVGLGADNLQCVCAAPTTTTFPQPTTTTVPAGVCNDGIVNQPTEQCDGEDDDACRGLCQFDCTCPAPVCGNGVKEIGEPCDGTDLGNETCASLGFDSGTVTCMERCTGFDSESCVLTEAPPDPAEVATPIDPTAPTDIDEAVEFLYRGNPRVQVGLSPEVIDAEHVAVVCGRVLDQDGAPLGGVEVRVLDHPEFGRTLTRADGGYDLVVNGGGTLTLSYDNDGKLPAQRPVKTPWRDFVNAPDVMLKPVDTATTGVEPNAGEMQVAQGNAVGDPDGTRTATVLFPAGTSADMVMPDGTAHPLADLTVRATEYTAGVDGPMAMPGELPPTSGYTYAVEYSIDEATAAGASSVTFNQPIPTYVENFVGFPVGSLVPAGSYDRKQGKWIPEDSGRVIEIVAVNGGAAELDVTGDGVADTGASLDDLGITTAELQKLATLYAPGTELWRVLSTHFTPRDYNWPFGPPPDSCNPGGCGDPPPGPKPPDKRPPKDPCKGKGSIIECEVQVLGETIRVAATPFTLNYRSDRLPGRKAAYTLHTRLSGAEALPASLQNILLEIRVAGRLIKKAFTPSANLVDTFTWDGRDVYGRMPQGSQPVGVRIGYSYRAQYYATNSAFQESYNRFGSVPTYLPTLEPDMSFLALTGRVTMPPIVLWDDYETSLGAWDARGLGLGGWSLDVHHAYDPNRQTLYLGNGDTRQVDGISRMQIDTVAPPRDGFSPSADLEVTENGDVLIADFANESIHQMAKDGTITRFAGNGFGCPVSTSACGDGGPANLAQLRSPNSVAIAPDGSVYIADFSNWKIRRVGLDGIITTVAGDGTDCFSTGLCGDGGPALEAKLRPLRVAVGPDGSVYFFDYTTSRIRRISPDGLITSVTGEASYCEPIPKTCGEGEPASKTGVDASDLVVAPDGTIYFASATNRVLRIRVDGILERVAGDGTACANSEEPCGDGADAKLAQLRNPRALALGADGSIYVADSDNSRIRKISPDGIITTIAGRGALGLPGVGNGDGGPATAAVIPIPTAVAVAEDGSVYMTSNGVRRAAPALPRFDGGSILLASEDGGEVYVFDAVGRHTGSIHALTGAVLHAFEYDAAGRLKSISDGDGNVTVIERDPSGVATAIIAQGGPRTSLAIDASGLLTAVTNPAGETTQLTYSGSDAVGLLTTYRDPKNQLYQFTYDAEGRLVSDKDPVNGTIQLARTELSDDAYSVDVTSAEGLITTYSVEALPNGDTRRVRSDPSGAETEDLIRADGSSKLTFPDGTVVDTVVGGDPRFGMQAPVMTQMTVTVPGKTSAVRTTTRTAALADPDNPFSLVSQTETVSLNGKSYVSVFEAATNTATTTAPGGRQSRLTIDAQGHPVAYQPAGSSAEVTWERDELGRLREVAQDGQSWTFDYADTHNPFRVSARTDALGRSSEFEFDQAQRIVEMHRPDGQALLYSYDANGNLTEVSLPGAASHALAYSATDYQVAYTPPGNPAPYMRQLDDDDRLIAVTLPSGATQSWSYDSFGRPAGVSTAEATMAITYDDPTSRPALIRRTAGAVTQDLVYVYAGYLVEELSFEGPASGTYSYAYDTDFRLTAMNLSNGTDEVALSFAYGADGLMTILGPFTVVRDVASGLPTSFHDGTGVHELTYDDRRRISERRLEVGAAELYAEELTYDPAGHIVRRIETVDGVESTYAYTYGPNGWLTQVKQNGTTVEQYAYDVRGNRTSRSLGGGPADASTYDVQDRQTTRGALGYGASVDGFVTQRGSDTFAYGARAELLVASVGGQAVSYGYDGLNRRTSRTAGGATAEYLYGNPLLPTQVTASRSPGGVLTVYVHDEGGRLLGLERGGDLYYVATDLLGTPKLIVDSTGAVVKELAWDSFGNLRSDSNPGFDLPIGFHGGVRDPLTGFTRFGVRDYEAASGRWTTRDPAAFDSRQTNLYAYVDNDPIDKRDPIGMFSLGGSAYDGAGGGFKLGITDEGISFCAEIGLGFGDSLELSPTGDLDDDGISLDASGQIKAGPFGSVEIAQSLKGCNKTETKFKNCVGPFCQEHQYKDGQWSQNRKGEVDPGDWKNAYNKFPKGMGLGLEGKVAVNFCAAGKW